MSIPNVELRQLGRIGPTVPRLGLGTISLGGSAYGLAAAEEERLAFLDEAYQLGARFWDTADEYADAEDLLGKWFAKNPEKRDDITLCTKFGIKAARENIRAMQIDSTPEYCREAIEKSLSRLGVQCIDVYYIHRLDKKTPVEKTMKVMAELVNEGKIKHVGMSECSAESLRRAHSVHPVACVQVEYSLFRTEIETPDIAILKTARELGIAVVAYCPLGNGLLTGNIHSREDVSGPGDLRGILPQLADENWKTNQAIIAQIEAVAKGKGVSASQLALAWLLAQGDDIFPIPGTSKAYRVKENMDSTTVSISAYEENALRELAKGVMGGRVQDMMGYAFADTPPLE